MLAGLQSSASPLVQEIGLPDPTGAFLAMQASWTANAHIRTINGVWFSQDGKRALMVAQTVSGGLNYKAGDRILSAIQKAFEIARTGNPSARQARLLEAGPAVFAHDAQNSIEADVRLLSIVSSLLVAALLFWRFRSLWVVLVIMIPLLFAASAGALAVQLLFGFVHGITLGFGTTMLGVAVDYPVLLIGHRKENEAASGTLERIGGAFNLAVVTALLGLTGMVFSRFPGLSQLGVFSVSGLISAALVTRYLLPRLIVAAGLAPVSAGDPALLARVEPLRRFRSIALLPLTAAILFIALRHGPKWDHDLSHLSPVPQAALALDASMRAEIGAPDVGQIVIVRAQSEEQVLEREEELLPIIDRLVREHTIGSADAAALLLPSARTQKARQSLLPQAPVLASNIQEAAAGLGFSTDAFQPFLNDVEAARVARPVTIASVKSRVMQARLGALLFERGGEWFGAIAPRSINNSQALALAFANQPDTTFVDIHAETNGVVDGYTRQAWPWLAGGAAAAATALAAGTRDGARLLRVVGCILASLTITIAALMLAGTRLSLIHVVALQFVAGIGLDYAVFFSRSGLDEEERSRTLRTLFTCNGMALLTFGLLCLCRTPLLQWIGSTVAIGVVASMIFAFLFAGPLINVGSRSA